MHRANSSNNTDAPEKANIIGFKSQGPGFLHVLAKLKINHFSEMTNDLRLRLNRS